MRAGPGAEGRGGTVSSAVPRVSGGFLRAQSSASGSELGQGSLASSAWAGCSQDGTHEHVVTQQRLPVHTRLCPSSDPEEEPAESSRAMPLLGHPALCLRVSIFRRFCYSSRWRACATRCPTHAALRSCCKTVKGPRVLGDGCSWRTRTRCRSGVAKSRPAGGHQEGTPTPSKQPTRRPPPIPPPPAEQEF